ncbi:hypothetical protein NX059_010225 [Plenodomus lindquistii]|nr:hypothetical protein NX059_010225 [Plenodomus lindquistii]
MNKTVQPEVQYNTSDDESRLADSVPEERAGVVKGAGADFPYKHELERKIQITERIDDKKQAKQLKVAHRRTNPKTKKAEYQLKETNGPTDKLYSNGKWYPEKDVRRL